MINLKMSKPDISLLLVRLTHFFVLFNSVLVALGIKYVYLVFILALIIFQLGQGLSIKTIRVFSTHFIYCLVLLVMLTVHVAFFDIGTSSFIAFGLYTMPIISWAIYYSGNTNYNFHRLFSETIFVSGVVGALGVIQYFFSPLLWGFIPTNSNALEWVVGKSFIQYAAFFRATSTLGSPQVFGLFCAIMIALLFEYRKQVNKNIFYFSFFSLMAGGVLTGNKSFFLIVFLYFFFTLFLKKLKSIKTFLLITFLAFVTISYSGFLQENIPMLERVLSLEAIEEQEQSDSRLDRYTYILNNTDMLFGNGLGEITNKSHSELRAAESYILKVYYEGGLFSLLGLLAILFATTVLAYFKSYEDFIIVLLILLGMIVVHAFESPAFYIIWGYLLSLFITEGKNKSNVDEQASN